MHNHIAHGYSVLSEDFLLLACLLSVIVPVKVSDSVNKPHHVGAVIFLDWSGVDLSSNPLHPASKLFDSRSSMELQCIYILNIERLGVNVVLQKEG